MPGVTIDWKSGHAYPRLIAALVASSDGKMDMHKIAAIYGQGATYNMIEGRFRIIKKEAADLKAAFEAGKTDQTPAVNVAAANGTGIGQGGKKAGGAGKKDKVITGRIVKGGAKPAAVGKEIKVKAELEEEEGGLGEEEGCLSGEEEG